MRLRVVVSSAIVIGTVLLAMLAANQRVFAGISAINAEGVFSDAALWIFETPAHTFGYSDFTKGTNEALNVLPPNVPAGMKPVAVQLMRHGMDFHGYPLHISLVDKLFGVKQNVGVFAAVNEELRKYEPGSLFGKETIVEGPGAPEYTVTGPMSATKTIPSQFQTAFEYVRSALSQLNLPAGQKNLEHYAVMFVDTKDITWVELAPVWGPDETPHLGCQTAMGRDMVFAFEKSAPKGKEGGAFLQCL